jgi:putative intracellular protease/amidase
MNRRTFSKSALTALAAGALTDRLTAQTAHPSPKPADPMHSVPAGPPQQIGMLLYPGMFALDLVGPHAFLSGLMNVQVHLLWKTRDPITASGKMQIVPTATLAECPANLDVLFVPGGLPGTVDMMRDDEVLTFLADRGARARYVTSVCTGSLVLGAAGLLNGYRATSHWATRDLLPLLGAQPVAERVVQDRNRITGGGVTAGMDFGLLLAARLRDRDYAEMLQLMNEYDPHPPFHAGSPNSAGPAMTAHLQAFLKPGLDACAEAAAAANKRLRVR